MYECIDSNNSFFSIEDYCLLKKVNRHPIPVYCPFCNNKVYIRGENSKEKTHFMHTPSCSTTNYKNLFGSTGLKKSNTDILSLKFSILSFSYDIFNHILSTFNINIYPLEFVNILEKLVKKKVLELLDVTSEIIPYICINELGRYKNKVFLFIVLVNFLFDKVFLYTNSYNKEIDKLWNLSPNSKKDIILCVDKNVNNTITRLTIPIDASFLENPTTHIPVSFIENIIPQIFTALNIDEIYHDFLLKDLLSNV